VICRRCHARNIKDGAGHAQACPGRPPPITDEQLDRLRSMAGGSQTWDLSDNDMEAIGAAVAEIERLRPAPSPRESGTTTNSSNEE
jgi:hypothetical protein